MLDFGCAWRGERSRKRVTRLLCIPWALWDREQGKSELLPCPAASTAQLREPLGAEV